MIEAMTEGGFKKKGVVFAPEDALGEDAVILRYLRSFPQRLEVLKENQDYYLDGFAFQTSMRHIHPVETLGLKFKIKNTSISLLTDTRYFKGLNKFYQTDIIIICVVFKEPRPGIDHLSLDDAAQIISDIKPKKAILTHFGMTMLKAKPRIQAEELSKKLGIEVIAAGDGMSLEF
jgi:phosphoribosyl 1,2-cyclic phosphodiesterase